MTAFSNSQLCLHYENGFPYKGSAEDRLRFLANFTAMCPSLGGSSPWRFEILMDRMILHQDLQPNLLPAGFPGPLAELGLRAGAPPSKADSELFNAILDWAKPHHRFAPKGLNATGLGNLLRRPEGSSASFRYQWSTDERLHLAALIVEGDRMHRQAEEDRLVRLGHIKRRRADRLRVVKKTNERLAEKLDEWTSRLLQRGLLTAPARRLAEAKPALIVLSTKGDEAADWLEAGRLLANTLLRGLI